MVGAWTPNGPVSLPPRVLAYGAGLLILLMAAAGVGLGLRAASRSSGAPDLGAVVSDDAGQASLAARPIVQAPPPDAAADANADANGDTADAATGDNIAQKTAAAQEVQSKPAKSAGNIDEILASPTEKPPAPVKPTTDEAPPPSSPVSTDVPF